MKSAEIVNSLVCLLIIQRRSKNNFVVKLCIPLLLYLSSSERWQVTLMVLLERLQTFCNQSRKKHENSWGDDPLPGSLVSARYETAPPPLVSRVWKTLDFCLGGTKMILIHGCILC